MKTCTTCQYLQTDFRGNESCQILKKNLISVHENYWFNRSLEKITDCGSFTEIKNTKI
jgi:hypothetical protein